MGLHLKRVLACVMAVSLVVVSLSEYPGMVRQAEAAERSMSTEESVQKQGQTLKKKQDGLRGATAEAGSSAVVFSKGSGTYGEAFDLELTCGDGAASGADIYFTTDGSDPADTGNEARTLYTPGSIHITDRKGDPNVLSAVDPILFDAVNVKASSDGKSFESTVEKPSDQDVDKCTVIKAAVQYADGTCSEVTTNTYFIGDMADHIEGIRESCKAAGMDLSVMSISMDAEDLFDSAKGIYVKGDVFQKALEEYLASGKTIDDWDAVDTCRGMDANYKQKGKKWERKTHIDYFESNGTETSCKLQQDCGIRIQGNYSRSDYQKSFRLYARTDYGNNNFKYAFWDQAKDAQDQTIDKYKKIVLRNGGNCAFTTKFSDSYWQSLIEGIDCDKQSARPCVVYLNGEYWGVYILQNDFCSDYFADKYGVDKNSVVVYKGDAEAITDLGYKLDEGDLPAGVTNENYYFEELENFMKEHDDLSDPANYEAFCQMVDKDSILDYFATQVWINNKWDWPGKNWSMWKTTSIDPNNPYADGKWRFLVYDVEFGGISGSDDASANTVKNSKLLTTGTDEKPPKNNKNKNVNWDKPNVRCFALMMTNPEFRQEYCTRLSSFSDTMFERSKLLDRAEQFKNIYQPILDQFFNRFPTLWNGEKKTADMVINGNGWDTYGTLANIIAFAKERADHIETITKWIGRQYPSSATPTPTPVSTDEPIQTPAPVPTQTPERTLAPSAVPEQNAEQSIQITLSDGAKKIVQIDPSGKVLSTKYQIDGVIYRLKSDKTLAFSADNNKVLKKKSSYVILDQVVAGGNRYKVTEIETAALQNLKKLKSVTIGENIKIIGKSAFHGCKKLKKVTFLGKKVTKIGSKAFNGIAKKAKMICPKAKRKAYQKLIKKSGVNLKKTQIKVAGIQAKNTKGIPNVLQVNRKTSVSGSGKAAETASVTMSSLVNEDGSFQNAKSGATVTIHSAEELKMLSQYTRSEHATAGVNFVQTADIDGTGMVMEPIGVIYCKKGGYDEDGYENMHYDEFPFQGTYDGAGYVIRNISISVQKSDVDTYYMALFGLTENALLKNIELESIAFVDADTLEPFAATENSRVNMAGIVSYMSGKEGGVIGSINHADLAAAGLGVSVTGVITNCYCYNAVVEDCRNDGKIIAKYLGKVDEDHSVYAGGIVGDVSCEISHCTNIGTIESDGDASGIAKYIYEPLTDCENTGDVTGKERAAGIVVNADYKLTQCKNSGKICSGGTAGGLAAILYDMVLNAENTGTISGGEYAGGIAGQVYYTPLISAVKNRGEVMGDGVAGGIAAYIRYGTVNNVQNLANVSGKNAVGGIVGCQMSTKLGNVWNYGAISGTSQIGGVAGSSDPKCFGLGSDSEGLGGTYMNCVSAGNVTGETETGALIGHSIEQDQLSRCYRLDGTDLPVSGTDSSLTAEAVSAETLKTADFVDTFNQELNAAQGAYMLPVQYDGNGELQWQAKIFLHLSGLSEENEETENQLKSRFIVKNAETDGTVPLIGQQGIYSFDAIIGNHFNISYCALDGTETVLYEKIALEEGEILSVLEQYLNSVQFYSSAEKVEDEEDGYYYSPLDVYQIIYFLDEKELSNAMPVDPEKEGYVFGGWYNRGCVTSEELYQEDKEYDIEEFRNMEEFFHNQWSESDDVLSEEYANEEDYVYQSLLNWFGAGTMEEYLEQYDEIFDKNYKVTVLKGDWGTEYLYAKWNKKTEDKPGDPIPKPSQTVQPTSEPGAGQTPQSSTVKPIDTSKYQDKEGDYVQKKGLIYKVNRKKKTATVVGVNSKSIAKATIVAKIKTGGKTYKVSAISQNAFKGCSGLKKIVAKGKSLKKVKKKALKMIRKKKK